MKAVLLDTGCIVALLDKAERYHQSCRDIVVSLSDSLVTCEAVVSEACFLLRRVHGARESILSNVEEGVFQIPFQLSGHASAVRRLMEKYRQIPMSLADACLVTMADELGTGRILTLDQDFTLYRWGGRRPFDLVITL